MIVRGESALCSVCCYSFQWEYIKSTVFEISLNVNFALDRYGGHDIREVQTLIVYYHDLPLTDLIAFP